MKICGTGLGDLLINHPWTRATPKAADVAAGFMKITNRGGELDRLIGVASTISDVSQIHTMVTENDVMKMQEIKDGPEIPAGATDGSALDVSGPVYSDIGWVETGPTVGAARTATRCSCPPHALR